MLDKYDTVVIGAGLTGLTLAYLLKQKGERVLLVEKSNSIGGVIRTIQKDGYTIETGPSTASLSTSETALLFEMLDDKAQIQIANKEAKRRQILKNNKIEELPTGLIGGVFTPLFSLKDKIRLLFEPFIRKGNNPNEDLATMTKRRLGSSFLDYAVSPFVCGVYAGNPTKLITRFAIPKLYNLEQKYGSFILGAINKKLQKKTELEKKATRDVFSAKGGFGNLIKALGEEIGEENILLNENPIISKDKHIKLSNKTVATSKIISTVGAYAIKDIFDFLPESLLSTAEKMDYAKVVQASIGVRNGNFIKKAAFGMLVPPIENRDILGVLYPSMCFDDRAPEGKTLLSVFLGGENRKDIIELTDDKIKELIVNELSKLYNLSLEDLDFIEIFRHHKAIAQYGIVCKKLLPEISSFEKENPGIIIAGSIRDGIGIPNRIKQAFDIANAF